MKEIVKILWLMLGLKIYPPSRNLSLRNMTCKHSKTYVTSLNQKRLLGYRLSVNKII